MDNVVKSPFNALKRAVKCEPSEQFCTRATLLLFWTTFGPHFGPQYKCPAHCIILLNPLLVWRLDIGRRLEETFQSFDKLFPKIPGALNLFHAQNATL